MAKVTIKERRFIITRASSCCEYYWSQLDFPPSPFAIEYIIPLIKNGTNDLDNLAFSCSGCNGHKYDHTDSYDPVSGELVPLYHPRQQLWANHFVWSVDFAEIIDTSPVGRATIDRLCLNRPGVVNFRRVLKAMNFHPPKLY